MHLKRQSCCGIPRKDHLVGRGLLVEILLLLVAVSSALAWNKAGHMVSGAIAYADLKQANPQTLARVIALRVAGKSVRKYTLRRYAFFFKEREAKSAELSTPS